MRLALPALILFCYCFFSLLIWLPCKPWLKVLLALTIFIISQKYLIYERIGGSFITPKLPASLQLILEFLYTALLMLVVVLIIKDILAFLLLISRFLGSSWQLPFSSGIRGLFLISVALFLAVVATWQSVRIPKVHRVTIPLPGLPAEFDGFSLVQLTDLHIGPLLGKKWLDGVVAKTNALEADVIVFTGDMIDGPPESLKREINPLAKLHAPYGVYGVFGNHEFYHGAARWQKVFESLGIEILNNEYRNFSVNDQSLILAGVPDDAARHFGNSGPDRNLVKKAGIEGTVILLQHRPEALTADDAIALQLSGHTHGGQLFFLKWLIASYNDGLVGGLVDFNGPKLYVSPGTGVWSGFSARLGVPSEITHIILRRQ